MRFASYYGKRPVSLMDHVHACRVSAFALGSFEDKAWLGAFMYITVFQHLISGGCDI
jgi:hypothetical protein